MKIFNTDSGLAKLNKYSYNYYLILLAIMVLTTFIIIPAKKTNALEKLNKTKATEIIPAKQISKVGKISKNNKSSSITILDKTKEKITRKFEDILTEHEKIKIITRKGLSKYSQLSFPYSKKNRKLKVYFIKLIKPNGKINDINLKDLKTTTAPFDMNAPIFSNQLLKTIQLPGLTKGTIIDYKYRQTVIKPYMKGNFFTEDYFGGLAPVKKSIYQLKIPKGIYFKYAEYKLNEKPKINIGKNHIALTWTMSNRGKITPEDFGPGKSFIIPHIMVSSVKSWNEAARWYSNLTKDQIKPNLSLKKFIASLVKSKENRLAKIKAIYDFVAKKIRYVGYEFGIDGYKPSNVNNVFKNKLGDCKDHATLFSSMLRSIGVKAYPVLIPTTMIPDMNVNLPTPFAFDHEITAIKFNKDQHYMFADTTSNVTTFGNLPPMDQGRNVLIVVHGKGISAKTPIFPAKKNNILFNESSNLSKNGELNSKITAKFTGAYDMYKRYVYTSISKRKKINKILKIIYAISPEAKLLHFSFKNEKSMDNPFFENISFNAKNYAIKNNNSIVFRIPIRVRTILSKIAILKKRRYSLKLGYNFSENNNINLKLPAGYRIYFKPKNIAIKNSAGQFEAKYIIKDRHVIFKSYLAIDGYKIPEKKYNEARYLFNKTIKYLSNQVLIAKKI